jgi:HlyD family secretion protein
MQQQPSHMKRSDSTRYWIIAGCLAVFGLFGGLALWSTLVTISGAVVASGTVTVESNYKTVQHLDGGIVAKILVQDGDLINKGQLLIRLDDTAARARLLVTMSRLHESLAKRVRLEAERDRLKEMPIPASLEKHINDPDVALMVAAQRHVFEARQSARLGERLVLDQRVAQLHEEVRGLQAQLIAKRREAELNTKELASIVGLFARGHATQRRLTQLKRDDARMHGEVGRLMSETARVKGQIAEVGLRIAQTEKEFTRSVTDELGTLYPQLTELEQSRVALTDTLNRIDIRAPHAGYVHRLEIHTEGGVIRPATPILQIVPVTKDMIIEAQVAPIDIDKVRPGQHTIVHFPAFDASWTPRLSGRVKRVSAAQISDPQGRSYFTALVEVSAEEQAKITKGKTLLPGMPAEVYIETGSRTVLSYLLKPLSDHFARAMREN